MENILTTYLIVTTLLFLLLGIAWQKGDWLNIIAKFIVFVLAITGIILTLVHFGILVRV